MVCVFGAYLGGIETLSLSFSDTRDEQFGAYLGGIETGELLRTSAGFLGVRSLPRRD